jgi:CHASE1-domain containing sensor protein
MHSAGARALREDDNEMSREAVLLQWERKIEAAERRDDERRFVRTPEHEAAVEERDQDGSAPAEPAELHPVETAPRPRRFQRSTPAGERRGASTDRIAPAAERRGASTDRSAPAAERRPRATERSFHLAPEPPAEPTANTAPEPAAQRRTITITGQPTPARRRRPVVDAQLAQPDRIALWAFLLGLLLVAVAAGTAHA